MGSLWRIINVSLVQILMLSLARLKLVYHRAGRDTDKMGIVARLADNFVFFVAAPPTALNVKMDFTYL